jgi:hypothetical protein
MRPPAITELLTVWERSIEQPLLQRTINLLDLSCPELDSDAIAKLSIGERDARLLLLREWMFGSRLINIADCPKCTERVEWENNIEDICLQSPQDPDFSKEFSLEVDEFKVRFRLPNSADVYEAIADEQEPPDPVRLLSRCILNVNCNDEVCDPDSLPDKVIEAINRRMDEEDPQADIHVALSCPHCEHRWELQFDIVSYLWAEIENWVERMLQVVGTLARAYGWSERDILNMSPVRRQIYLDMVNS